jgi:hypothetical protein
MRRNRLRVHMGELQSSQTGAGYSSESISRTGDTTHYSSRCSSTRVRLPCSSPNVLYCLGGYSPASSVGLFLSSNSSAIFD